MGIALVKSYMNKLQTRIKERYPKWSNFLTVFLFLCILFKYFSSFALPKNWRQGNCLYRHGLATAQALLLTYSYKPV